VGKILKNNFVDSSQAAPDMGSNPTNSGSFMSQSKSLRQSAHQAMHSMQISSHKIGSFMQPPPQQKSKQILSVAQQRKKTVKKADSEQQEI